jgi:hypothetical protein
MFILFRFYFLAHRSPSFATTNLHSFTVYGFTFISSSEAVLSTPLPLLKNYLVEAWRLFVLLALNRGGIQPTSRALNRMNKSLYRVVCLYSPTAVVVKLEKYFDFGY